MTNSEEIKPEILDTFGVGCFHFQSLKALNPQNGFEEYKKNVIDFLNRDNLVKEIEFLGFPDDCKFRGFKEANSSLYGYLDEIEFLYPSFNSGTIRIKIVIPFRLQKEYIGTFGEILDCEDFTISIVYHRHRTAAFVRTDKLTDDPSKAVVVAWKHMQKNWNDSDSIQFCMLGPSPFHADFFVLKNTERKNYIELKRRYGYDDVNIYIYPEIPKDATIESLIHFRMKDELSLFYSIILKINKLNREFSQIETDVNQFFLSELERKSGYFAKPSKFDAYRAHVRLEKIDADIQSVDRYFKRDREHIAQKFGESSLDAISESYIDELKEIPVTQYRNIIATLKERHSTRSTNKATIISAFLGVILGFMLQIVGDFANHDEDNARLNVPNQASDIQPR